MSALALKGVDRILQALHHDSAPIFFGLEIGFDMKLVSRKAVTYAMGGIVVAAMAIGPNANGLLLGQPASPANASENTVVATSFETFEIASTHAAEITPPAAGVESRDDQPATPPTSGAASFGGAISSTTVPAATEQSSTRATKAAPSHSPSTTVTIVDIPRTTDGVEIGTACVMVRNGPSEGCD